MTSSSLIKDYVGVGVDASLPGTAPVGTGVGARYYATDTAKDYVWNGSAWVQANTGGGGGYPAYSPPAAALFTDTTSLSAPTKWADGAVAGLLAVAPATGSTGTSNLTGRMKAITGTNWVVQICPSAIAVNFHLAGLILGNGTNTKFITLALAYSSGYTIYASAWNSVSAFSAHTFTVSGPPLTFQSLRIHDDGTNLNFYYGVDSEIWVAIGSVGRTSFMGVAPTKVGLFMNNQSASTLADIGFSVPYWKES